jgi:hypothetical protein
MNPMRMLILLAVFWAAGSLLLAAESPSTSVPKPAPAASTAEAAPAGDKSAAAKADDKADAKKSTKDGDKANEKADDQEGAAKPPGSLAEQAEAALKAAQEGAGDAPAAAAKDESKEDAGAAPAATTAKGPSPQRFVPTEQVRADFDVSFPIDI